MGLLRESTLVPLDGGTFRMGSADFYPEEAPVVAVTVNPFQLETTAVTNGQYAAFVADTGYVTVAERQLDPAAYPEAESLDPGSLVFRITPGPVDLRDWRQWWHWVPGAWWREPLGPGSSLADKDDHPVVQVSYEDATAYAAWAGRRLPSEAEWEFAARGGLDGAPYAWGDVAFLADGLRANTWQGRFPYLNTGAKGWRGTAPVGTFPANPYGLYDMIGNVWEWTASEWSADHKAVCPCSPPPAGDAGRVLKGGSHLCAPEYCLRYRPAARTRQSEDSATTHIGFRCAA